MILQVVRREKAKNWQKIKGETAHSANPGVQGSAGLRWIAMDCNGLQWSAPDCDGLQRIVMDCDGLWWIALKCANYGKPIVQRFGKYCRPLREYVVVKQCWTEKGSDQRKLIFVEWKSRFLYMREFILRSCWFYTKTTTIISNILSTLSNCFRLSTVQALHDADDTNSHVSSFYSHSTSIV